MFLVVQMAEVLVWVISQYHGINSQLLHQGMGVFLTGKMTACSPAQAHLWMCACCICDCTRSSLKAFRLHSPQESVQLSVKNNQHNHSSHWNGEHRQPVNWLKEEKSLIQPVLDRSCYRLNFDQFCLEAVRGEKRACRFTSLSDQHRVQEHMCISLYIAEGQEKGQE